MLDLRSLEYNRPECGLDNYKYIEVTKNGDFKIGKGVCQGCILSLYLTYMPSTSCEMRGWMNHKLESRLLGERTNSDMQMISP